VYFQYVNYLTAPPLQVVKFLYALLATAVFAIATAAIQLAAPSHVLASEMTSAAAPPVWPNVANPLAVPVQEIKVNAVERRPTANLTASCKPVEAENRTYVAVLENGDFNFTYFTAVLDSCRLNFTGSPSVVKEVGRGGVSFFDALRLAALALGAALFLYGAYLAKCRGAECLLDRAKSLLYLSAASIAASLAALPSQPLAVLPVAVGAYGLWRFYVGIRRVRKWLSTTLM